MTIDEGVDAKTGIRTVYRFEAIRSRPKGLRRRTVHQARAGNARAQRRQTMGRRQRGRRVAALVLPQINAIGDEAERTKAMKLFSARTLRFWPMTHS